MDLEPYDALELYVKARVAYAEAAERDPYNAISLLSAARLELDASRPELALPLLMRSVELEPRYREAHAQLLKVARSTGDKLLAEREEERLRQLALDATRLRPGSRYESTILARPKGPDEEPGAGAP